MPCECYPWMRWDILKRLGSRPREDLALPLGCTGSGRRCVRAHLGSPNTRGVAVKHSLHFTCTCSGWWKCVCTVGRKRTRGSLPPLPPEEEEEGLLPRSFSLSSPPPPLLWWPLGYLMSFFSPPFSFPFCFSLSVRVCACVLSHFLDHFCVFYYFSVPQAAATR